MKKSNRFFLFSHMFEVSVTPQTMYEVHVHSADEFSFVDVEVYPCKTFIGALFKAWRLVKNRNDGWSEKMAVTIFDVRKYEFVCGFKTYPVTRHKVVFSRFIP